MTTPRSRRSAGGIQRVALMIAACGIALTGCGSTQNGAASTPTTGVTTAAKGAARPGVGSKSDAHSTKEKLPKGVETAKPKDPLAPKKIAQVKRNGKVAKPSVRVKGGTRTFSQRAVYSDGLVVTIDKMTQGKVSGEGPGVYPGRPVTDFYITLTNGTKKTLHLGVVVLTVAYGSPARLAHAVYTPKAKDFAGVVKPGKSIKAIYGFSVPKANRNDVTLTVDLDGQHHLATFAGKVK